MKFAIDRLHDKQKAEKTKTVEPVVEEPPACSHPSWIVNGDGHTQTWYNCAVCGHYSWIAPWVLNSGRKSIDDDVPRYC